MSSPLTDPATLSVADQPTISVIAADEPASSATDQSYEEVRAPHSDDSAHTGVSSSATASTAHESDSGSSAGGFVVVENDGAARSLPAINVTIEEEEKVRPPGVYVDRQVSSEFDGPTEIVTETITTTTVGEDGSVHKHVAKNIKRKEKVVRVIRRPSSASLHSVAAQEATASAAATPATSTSASGHLAVAGTEGVRHLEQEQSSARAESSSLALAASSSESTAASIVVNAPEIKVDIAESDKQRAPGVYVDKRVATEFDGPTEIIIEIITTTTVGEDGSVHKHVAKNIKRKEKVVRVIRRPSAASLHSVAAQEASAAASGAASSTTSASGHLTVAGAVEHHAQHEQHSESSSSSIALVQHQDSSLVQQQQEQFDETVSHQESTQTIEYSACSLPAEFQGLAPGVYVDTKTENSHDGPNVDIITTITTTVTVHANGSVHKHILTHIKRVQRIIRYIVKPAVVVGAVTEQSACSETQRQSVSLIEGSHSSISAQELQAQVAVVGVAESSSASHAAAIDEHQEQQIEQVVSESESSQTIHLLASEVTAELQALAAGVYVDTKTETSHDGPNVEIITTITTTTTVYPDGSVHKQIVTHTKRIQRIIRYITLLAAAAATVVCGESSQVVSHEAVESFSQAQSVSIADSSSEVVVVEAARVEVDGACDLEVTPSTVDCETVQVAAGVASSISLETSAVATDCGSGVQVIGGSEAAIEVSSTQVTGQVQVDECVVDSSAEQFQIYAAESCAVITGQEESSTGVQVEHEQVAISAVTPISFESSAVATNECVTGVQIVAGSETLSSHKAEVATQVQVEGCLQQSELQATATQSFSAAAISQQASSSIEQDQVAAFGASSISLEQVADAATTSAAVKFHSCVETAAECEAGVAQEVSTSSSMSSAEVTSQIQVNECAIEQVAVVESSSLSVAVEQVESQIDAVVAESCNTTTPPAVAVTNLTAQEQLLVTEAQVETCQSQVSSQEVCIDDVVATSLVVVVDQAQQVDSQTTTSVSESCHEQIEITGSVFECESAAAILDVTGQAQPECVVEQQEHTVVSGSSSIAFESQIPPADQDLVITEVQATPTEAEYHQELQVEAATAESCSLQEITATASSSAIEVTSQVQEQVCAAEEQVVVSGASSLALEQLEVHESHEVIVPVCTEQQFGQSSSSISLVQAEVQQAVEVDESCAVTSQDATAVTHIEVGQAQSMDACIAQEAVVAGTVSAASFESGIVFSGEESQTVTSSSVAVVEEEQAAHAQSSSSTCVDGEMTEEQVMAAALAAAAASSIALGATVVLESSQLIQGAGEETQQQDHFAANIDVSSAYEVSLAQEFHVCDLDAATTHVNESVLTSQFEQESFVFVATECDSTPAAESLLEVATSVSHGEQSSVIVEVAADLHAHEAVFVCESSAAIQVDQHDAVLGSSADAATDTTQVVVDVYAGEEHAQVQQHEQSTVAAESQAHAESMVEHSVHVEEIIVAASSEYTQGYHEVQHQESPASASVACEVKSQSQEVAAVSEQVQVAESHHVEFDQTSEQIATMDALVTECVTNHEDSSSTNNHFASAGVAAAVAAGAGLALAMGAAAAAHGHQQESSVSVDCEVTSQSQEAIAVVSEQVQVQESHLVESEQVVVVDAQIAQCATTQVQASSISNESTITTQTSECDAQASTTVAVAVATGAGLALATTVGAVAAAENQHQESSESVSVGCEVTSQSQEIIVALSEQMQVQESCHVEPAQSHLAEQTAAVDAQIAECSTTQADSSSLHTEAAITTIQAHECDGHIAIAQESEACVESNTVVVDEQIVASEHAQAVLFDETLVSHGAIALDSCISNVQLQEHSESLVQGSTIDTQLDSIQVEHECIETEQVPTTCQYESSSSQVQVEAMIQVQGSSVMVEGESHVDIVASGLVAESHDIEGHDSASVVGAAAAVVAGAAVAVGVAASVALSSSDEESAEEAGAHGETLETCQQETTLIATEEVQQHHEQHEEESTGSGLFVGGAISLGATHSHDSSSSSDEEAVQEKIQIDAHVGPSTTTVIVGHEVHESSESVDISTTHPALETSQTCTTATATATMVDESSSSVSINSNIEAVTTLQDDQHVHQTEALTIQSEETLVQTAVVQETHCSTTASATEIGEATLVASSVIEGTTATEVSQQAHEVIEHEWPSGLAAPGIVSGAAAVLVGAAVAVSAAASAGDSSDSESDAELVVAAEAHASTTITTTTHELEIVTEQETVTQSDILAQQDCATALVSHASESVSSAVQVEHDVATSVASSLVGSGPVATDLGASSSSDSEENDHECAQAVEVAASSSGSNQIVQEDVICLHEVSTTDSVHGTTSAAAAVVLGADDHVAIHTEEDVTTQAEQNECTQVVHEAQVEHTIEAVTESIQEITTVEHMHIETTTEAHEGNSAQEESAGLGLAGSLAIAGAGIATVAAGIVGVAAVSGDSSDSESDNEEQVHVEHIVEEAAADLQVHEAVSVYESSESVQVDQYEAVLDSSSAAATAFTGAATAQVAVNVHEQTKIEGVADSTVVEASTIESTETHQVAVDHELSTSHTTELHVAHEVSTSLSSASELAAAGTSASVASVVMLESGDSSSSDSEHEADVHVEQEISVPTEHTYIVTEQTATQITETSLEQVTQDHESSFSSSAIGLAVAGAGLVAAAGAGIIAAAASGDSSSESEDEAECEQVTAVVTEVVQAESSSKIEVAQQMESQVVIEAAQEQVVHEHESSSSPSTFGLAAAAAAGAGVLVVGAGVAIAAAAASGLSSDSESDAEGECVQETTTVQVPTKVEAIEHSSTEITTVTEEIQHEHHKVETVQGESASSSSSSSSSTASSSTFGSAALGGLALGGVAAVAGTAAAVSGYGSSSDSESDSEDNKVKTTTGAAHIETTMVHSEAEHQVEAEIEAAEQQSSSFSKIGLGAGLAAAAGVGLGLAAVSGASAIAVNAKHELDSDSDREDVTTTTSAIDSLVGGKVGAAAAASSVSSSITVAHSESTEETASSALNIGSAGALAGGAALALGAIGSSATLAAQSSVDAASEIRQRVTKEATEAVEDVTEEVTEQVQEVEEQVRDKIDMVQNVASAALSTGIIWAFIASLMDPTKPLPLLRIVRIMFVIIITVLFLVAILTLGRSGNLYAWFLLLVNIGLWYSLRTLSASNKHIVQRVLESAAGDDKDDASPMSVAVRTVSAVSHTYFTKFATLVIQRTTARAEVSHTELKYFRIAFLFLIALVTWFIVSWKWVILTTVFAALWTFRRSVSRLVAHRLASTAAARGFAGLDVQDLKLRVTVRLVHLSLMVLTFVFAVISMVTWSAYAWFLTVLMGLTWAYTLHLSVVVLRSDSTLEDFATLTDGVRVSEAVVSGAVGVSGGVSGEAAVVKESIMETVTETVVVKESVQEMQNVVGSISTVQSFVARQ